MCYSIVILFVYKVLLDVLFEGFKAVSVCGVVVRQNNSVVRCNSVGGVVCRAVVVLWIDWCLVLVLWIG